MGSGPSKPKKEKSPPPRSDNVSKSARQLKIDTNEKKQVVGTVGENRKVTEPSKTETNKINAQTLSTNSKNVEKKNGNINNNHVQKHLGNFESDSESEGEDINAVLEATRNEYNTRLKAQNESYTRDSDASYPETYAQRLQREQYRNQPQGILRQKTIYRNPDEWEVDENETESFDVSKFKEANLQKNPPTEENSMLNRDIFSPNIQENNTQPRTKIQEPENYYFQPNQRQKSLPRYDTSEEALLDEIEKEFEL